MWDRIKKFFKGSETIFVARLQVFLGAVAAMITFVQPEVIAPILPASWAPYALVAYGLAMEYLRRRRAEDL